MNDTKNICRLCLKFDRKTISLYNARSVESMRINKLVQQVCLIKLAANEPFPKCICFPCRKKVFNTWEFVNTCKESDKTLRKIYYNNVDKDDNNLDPEVKNAKPEENTEESKMEVEESENDVAERLQTLRSSKKVAFIASLSMCADLSPNESDQKPFEGKKETPKLEEANEEETQEEKTEELIKITKDEEKTSFPKDETISHRIPVESAVIEKSELETEPEVENKDIQKVTIKEEFIIPENEDEDAQQLEGQEDLYDPLLNVQTDLIEEGHFVNVKEELPDSEMKKDFHHEEDETSEDNLDTELDDGELENNSQSETVESSKLVLKKVSSCPICNRVYDRRCNLQKHMKLQHNISRMKGVPLTKRQRKAFLVREQIQSNINQNTFDLRVGLNDQLENPQQALQVQCEHCNASFTTVNAKRRHQQVACSKPYECLFCNTKYKLFKDFRVHMQTHKK